MKDRFGRIAWLIVFIVAGSWLRQTFVDDTVDPQVRRPDPLPFGEAHTPPTESGRELPPISPRDPSFTIEAGTPTSSVGTAFAIRPDGVWMTARHVVDGCTRIWIVTGPRRGTEVRRAVIHPNADVAVVWAGRQPPAIAMSEVALTIGQSGFEFGFPEGRPGQVHGKLIGRRKMRVGGRYHTSEPVLAWSEQRRIPDTNELGGISGGPTLDRNGRVVGVAVASTNRRGRVYTAAPVSIAEVIRMAGIRPSGRPSAGVPAASLNERDFQVHGDALRRQLSVAQVACVVKERRRRPRLG